MIREQQEQIKAKDVYGPKQTLYIKNLNEKIKPRDMKHALYALFSTYGQVIQIICKRSNKMRGQAFIVFKQVVEAQNAKNNLNGYQIFNKPMKIAFSAKRSEVSKFNDN